MTDGPSTRPEQTLHPRGTFAGDQNRPASEPLLSFQVHLLLVLGVATLFLPWAVRTVTEWTGWLEALKVLHLTVVGTVLLSTFVAISWLKGEFRLGSLRPSFRLWYGYLLVWGLWMVVWGILNNPPVVNFVAEVCAMALFLVGVAVGASTRNWQLLDRIVPVGLGLVGIPVVLAGLAIPGSTNWDRLNFSIVYTASAILIPATFYVLVSSRLRSKWHRVFVTGAFLLYGVCQFLFAKRGPLLRVLVIFFLAYWVIPGWLKQRRLVRRTLGALLLGIAVALAATLAGESGWEAVAGRFERFAALEGLIGDPRGSNVWNDPGVDNETFRVKEIGYFFDDMSSLQRLVGAGLGSYSRDSRLLYAWTVSTGEGGSVIAGKSTTHVGMFWAFFKGGAPYFLLFHLGVIGALRGLRRIRQNPLKLNAWAFVLTYLVFSMAEGFWMAPGVELTTFLMGASVGALAAQE